MVKMIITNKQDLLDHVGVDSLEQLKKRIYKDTFCGAWIEIKEPMVTVGSIVEGSDVDCQSYTLEFPFHSDIFWACIEAIEEEADLIWAWANVEREDGMTDCERGLDCPHN